MRLSTNEASDILLDYAGRLIVGKDLDISEESAAILAQYIPIVALESVR